MDINMMSKLWVGMSTTNIHLLLFQIQSYLQKRALWMSVGPTSEFITKKKIIKKLHSAFCIFFINLCFSYWIVILSRPTLESNISMKPSDTLQDCLFYSPQRRQKKLLIHNPFGCHLGVLSECLILSDLLCLMQLLTCMVTRVGLP